MAKRENVQTFARLAGQFSTQGQVLREQVNSSLRSQNNVIEHRSLFPNPNGSLFIGARKGWIGPLPTYRNIYLVCFKACLLLLQESATFPRCRMT
jgi:hypothetical protein